MTMIHVFAKPIPSFMWCTSFLSLSGDVLFYIVALCIDKNVFTCNICHHSRNILEYPLISLKCIIQIMTISRGS